MRFFNSIHCESQAHCKTCRAPGAGRAWRESLRAAFADIPARDFDCPHGKPWAELPNPEQPFLEAKAAIEAAPDAGPWTALKAQLHEVETAVYAATENCSGNCAKNKARAELVLTYRAVIQKETDHASNV